VSNARIDRMCRELHVEPPLQFFESLLSLAKPSTNALARREAEAHQSFTRTLSELFAHGGAAR
jgi:hypothetical protein